MGYDPHGSGLMQGGGVRGAKPRRSVVQGRSLKHFPDVHLTDSWTIRHEVPDFDPALAQEYTRRELALLAEKILLEDPKLCTEHPAWLSVGRLRERQRREIYCAAGTPDPNIVAGMYWRTHPEGRKWHEDRSGGRSWYR